MCALLPQAAAMSVDEARHLLSRTGFGAAPGEIAAFTRYSREEAVDRLLQGVRTEAHTAPPAAVLDYMPPRQIRALDEDARKAFRGEQLQRAFELRVWWVGEMLGTASPLTERMTLFWHNHFVSSQQKVRSTRLMYRQNVLLRRHALGNFGALLHAVSKDPAMLVYLDSATSSRGQPNENFAREVMELFTLGEGHYAEQDIKEAARAFTGWNVEPETGEFRWRPFFHDNGIKAVLGRRGNLDGDAMLDILLQQPQTAEFIVGKLWREFVSPDPEPAEVRRIARSFRDSGYQIKVAVRALLLAPAFYAPANRATLVKSPVDIVVGTLRQLGVSVADPLPFAIVLARLGQNLFAPPNVRGWPSGEAWLNSTTLLARKQFLARVLRADDGAYDMRMMAARVGPADDVQPRDANDMKRRLRSALAGVHFDGDAWLRQVSAMGLSAAAVLLAGAPVQPAPVEVQGTELIRFVAQDPMYQLK
jgi:uncharacterized protein (DUF1800 family)